jgi:hypothetical protein
MRKKLELRLMSEIADRAFELRIIPDRQRNFINLMLDIENFHALQPLELEMLLRVGRGDFAHDIVGIWNHYDRASGTITGCFTARCAQSNHRADPVVAAYIEEGLGNV